jgi:hypothetical protein
MKKQLEDGDFIYKCNSNIWPSNDPKDNPFDDYICKYCGHKISFQACGTFSIIKGCGTIEEKKEEAERKKYKHMLECKNWPANNQLPKCPFFQEPCLREKCTAFILRDTLGKPYISTFGDLSDVVADIISDQPYCTALEVFLSQIKEEKSKDA